MSDRKPGFYWVRLTHGDETWVVVGEWTDEPAEGIGRHWWATGSDWPYKDESVVVLSPRLEPPA